MKLLVLVLALFSAFLVASASEALVPPTATPWRLSVHQSQLDSLKHRLESAIIPDGLEDVRDWSWGTPASFVREMRTYWLEKYDWRAREKYINDALVSQYIMKVEGLNLHFVHVKSENKSAVPLLVSHGWPGSVLECTKIIPLLKAKFHIVCPSIPGYFFSEAPKTKGYDTERVADVFSSLMRQLGYTYYMAQGGDWGSEISRWISIKDPNCIGIHINMVTTQLPYLDWSVWGFWETAKMAVQMMFPTWFFDSIELEYLDRMQTYGLSQSAYLHYHMTMPESLSYALSDSPLGLAAYLWEKYHNWADLKQGSLLHTFTKDELIDFVMVYWVSNCTASSLRLYKESVPKMASEYMTYIHKPVAVAAFKDILVVPRAWAALSLNIERWTYFSIGGHFAALESPDLLASDIISFASHVAPFFKTGFIPPRPAFESMGFGDQPEL